MSFLIQTGLETLLLTGFGLFKAVEDKIERSLEEFQAGFQELAFQGSCDHSELAQGLRGRLDQILSASGLA